MERGVIIGEMARGTSTDDRLDDLSRRADTGSFRLDRDLRELRVEMSQNMARTDAGFDALHGLIIRVGGGMIIALFGMIAALVARGS